MTEAPNPRPDEDWDDPAKTPQTEPKTHVDGGIEGTRDPDTEPEGEDPLPGDDDLTDPNEETDTTTSQEPEDQGETAGLAEG